MSDQSYINITEVLELSRLLGEFGQIIRVTKLPNGDYEPDSHHSFAVALTAFDAASKWAPELDTRKILLYGLVHDLPEMITGDMPTLTASTDELQQKAHKDAAALEQTMQLFADYPHITAALRDFEAGVDDEALFVYWIDKMITIPSHFYDQGENLRALGVQNRQEIAQWYERISAKLRKRSGTPHLSAVKILELAYYKMRDELLE